MPERTKQGTFAKGFVKKEELAASLRAHQAAVDATRRTQREIQLQQKQKWRGERGQKT